MTDSHTPHQPSPEGHTEDNDIPTGTVHEVNGVQRIRVESKEGKTRDVKYYDMPTRQSITEKLTQQNDEKPPKERMSEKHLTRAINRQLFEFKKELIHTMEKRFFENVDRSLKTPAKEAEALRKDYNEIKDSNDVGAVRGAASVLAGALFNQMSKQLDDFAKTHEKSLNEDANKTPKDKKKNGKTSTENILEEQERQIGETLVELMGLAKNVYLINERDTVEEMIGEPGMAFGQLERFYEHRYNKIAHAQEVIDSLSTKMKETFQNIPAFQQEHNGKTLDERIDDFKDAAINAIETQKKDPNYASEIANPLIAARNNLRIHAKQAELPTHLPEDIAIPKGGELELGKNVLEAHTRHITHIVNSRVDLPKGTEHLEDRMAQLTRLHERIAANGIKNNSIRKSRGNFADQSINNESPPHSTNR